MSSSRVFIEKLHLRNFRSVRDATVTFDNPLFLVGRNGTGKSNLVDAFAFLADCMSRPLQAAVDARGGIGQVSNVRPDYDFGMAPVSIRVDFKNLGRHRQRGHYAFSGGFAFLGSDFDVEGEQCVLESGSGERVWFERRSDDLRTSVPGLAPSVTRGALALPLVGGTEEFAPALRALQAMRVYAVEPNRVRANQEGGSGADLRTDGANVAGALLQMAGRDRHVLERVTESLAPLVPGLVGVEPALLRDNRVVLVFRQQRAGGHVIEFGVSAMSDGTLRALALMVAALREPAPSLLVIEEPEIHLHPGALGVMNDLIETAARRTQVLVTTHSPDLLDAKWIQAKNIRVVTWEDDATRVSPLGVVPVKALRTHLMGAGELLRSNALDPEKPGPASASAADALFEPVAA